MNLSDLVLTKAPLTWPDVHKQLLNAIQTRSGVQAMSASQLNVVVSGQQQGVLTGSSASSTLAMSASAGAASSSGAAIAAIISSSNSSVVVNKHLVKQCTDLLIKHIKSIEFN